MKLSGVQIFRWFTRILSVASLLLLLMFIVGEDGIKPSRVALREWVGLAFFPFGVGVGLIVGWWKEKLGGVIVLLNLLAFYFIYGLMLRGTLALGWYFVLFASPGLLYFLSAMLKNNSLKPLPH